MKVIVACTCHDRTPEEDLRRDQVEGGRVDITVSDIIFDLNLYA